MKNVLKPRNIHCVLRDNADRKCSKAVKYDLGILDLQWLGEILLGNFLIENYKK